MLCVDIPDELSGKGRDIPITLYVDQAAFHNLAIAGCVHQYI